MVTISKIENTIINPDNLYILAELRGLSTDEKPVKIGEKQIANGSVFIEIDTQKLYFFDADTNEWKGE